MLRIEKERTVHVVVAPDKFKGSLTAREVADRVAAGIAAVRSGASEVVRVPVADGGDGTVDAALAAGLRADPGARRPARPASRSTPPTRCATGSRWSRWPTSPGCGCCRRTGSRRSPRPPTAPARSSAPRWTGAAAASCSASAAARAPTAARACWRRSARGCSTPPGTRCRAAAARWPTSTASTCPACTRPWPAPGSSWPATSTTRCSARTAPPRSTGRRRARARTTSRCSTRRSRTGPTSSTPRPAARTSATARAPGPPAASATRRWPCSARSSNRGSGWCSTSSGFADHLPGARLVITGEGSLDEQTLHGKAPAGVAAAAAKAGIPVVTVSGRLALDRAQLQAAGIAAAYALTDIEPDVQRCLAEAGPLLERLATNAGP